jgi:N-acetylmuramic acid 6-phosphate etherase
MRFAPDFESPTEDRLLSTSYLDTLGSLEILRLMHREDLAAVAAVGPVLPHLARLVDRADSALRAGGRIHYFGSGTSGRLGVLDAAELIPTFSLPPGLVCAHLSGGSEAMVGTVEDSEDHFDDGYEEARDADDRAVVIGLTASGRTPYVAGALTKARECGAFTALVTSNPKAPLAVLSDLVISPNTGAEVLAGSTRLKAGTAEKLILNGFSTALMIRQGRTWRGLMVSVQASNEKLRARARRILSEGAGVPPAVAARLLDQVGGDLKTALVAALGEVPPALARQALADARGSVREAIVSLLAAAGTIHDDDGPPKETSEGETHETTDLDGCGNSRSPAHGRSVRAIG